MVRKRASSLDLKVADELAEIVRVRGQSMARECVRIYLKRRHEEIT